MKQAEIKEKLNSVKDFVSNNDIIGGMTDFIFKKGRLYGYNDRVFSAVVFEMDSDFSVPAKEFEKIINEIDFDQEVELTIDESSLNINAGDISGKLVIGKDKEVFNIIPEFPEKFVKLPENFQQAMKICMYTCLKDIGNIKTCVCFSGNKAKSTDLLRISIYEMSSELKEQILIPSEHAKLLSKFNLNGFNSNDSWIFFNSETAILGSRKVNDSDYPEVESFFDFEALKISFPKEIIDLVETAEVLSSEDVELEKSIEINVGPDFCVCKGENEKGIITRRKDGIETGLESPITFMANPEMLRIALKGDYSIKVSSDYSRMLFEMNNFKQLHCLKAE